MKPFLNQDDLGPRRSRRAEIAADLVFAACIVGAIATAVLLLINGVKP